MTKQLSLFGVQYEEPKKEVVTYKEFTYASAFSGIGGMTMGLEGLGGKGVMAWEYDPASKRQYAQEAHRLLHPHISVEGDICQVDTSELADFDVLCFTPPCQSFSVAGKRGGFEDTRGTLTFEALRIAKDKQPKVLFMENVKGLVNHDKGNTMGVIIAAINDIGYTVDFTVLNSKYFDVAQNRERVYLVAVRNDLITPEPWNNIKGNTMLPKAKAKYMAEGARTFNFDWPEQTKVRTRLRDFLEEAVDEKYYLSEDKTAALVAQLEDRHYVDVPQVLTPEKTEYGKAIRKQYESGEVEESFHNMRIMRPRTDEITNTLTTVQKDNYVSEPIEGLPIREATKQVYTLSEEGDPVNIAFLNSDTHRGRVVKQIANTIEASGINQEVVESIPAILDTRNKSADIKSGKSGIRVSYDICPTISATEQKDTKKIIELVDYIGSYDPEKLRSNGKPKYLEVYGVLNSDGQSQTIKTGAGGNQEPKILEEVRPVITPERSEKQQNGRRFKDDGEESFTITTIDRHGVAIGNYPKYRIRKLTPKECLRLQSVSEENIDKLLANFSDSRCYKFAGNGLTTNVIKAIGEKLLKYL